MRFPVGQIQDGSVTDFDLFLDMKGEQVLYATPGYLWTREETTRLLAAGMSEFLVRPEQALQVQMYKDLAKLPLIEREQEPRIRIKSIEDIAVGFTKCLYAGEVTQAAVRYGERIARGMIECLMEKPDVIKEIGGLVDHDQYTYLHSSRVAVFSTAMALRMDVTDEGHLVRIASGGLFHDVGKKDIPLSVINKPGALSEAEWAQMRAHPEKGHGMLEASGLSVDTLEIVLHHHERMNGGGYPHGLDQGAIMTEVQIAAVADIYDALTSARSYQKRRTRYEALDFMKHKLLGHDISPAAFRALVAALT
jgi:HD-GYP domain-containing protein (c-di-GMP phosphodiesterase class II)